MQVLFSRHQTQAQVQDIQSYIYSDGRSNFVILYDLFTMYTLYRPRSSLVGDQLSVLKLRAVLSNAVPIATARFKNDN
jgi:hypothetical protein